jgi:hypothetical protein
VTLLAALFVFAPVPASASQVSAVITEVGTTSSKPFSYWTSFRFTVEFKGSMVNNYADCRKLMFDLNLAIHLTAEGNKVEDRFAFQNGYNYYIKELAIGSNSLTCALGRNQGPKLYQFSESQESVPISVELFADGSPIGVGQGVHYNSDFTPTGLQISNYSRGDTVSGFLDLKFSGSFPSDWTISYARVSVCTLSDCVLDERDAWVTKSGINGLKVIYPTWGLEDETIELKVQWWVKTGSGSSESARTSLMLNHSTSAVRLPFASVLSILDSPDEGSKGKPKVSQKLKCPNKSINNNTKITCSVAPSIGGIPTTIPVRVETRVDNGKWKKAKSLKVASGSRKSFTVYSPSTNYNRFAIRVVTPGFKRVYSDNYIETWGSMPSTSSPEQRALVAALQSKCTRAGVISVTPAGAGNVSGGNPSKRFLVTASGIRTYWDVYSLTRTWDIGVVDGFGRGGDLAISLGCPVWILWNK